MAVVALISYLSKFVMNDVNDGNVRLLEGMKAHAVGSSGGEPLGVSVMERASK
jgi:hypothetical protein